MATHPSVLAWRIPGTGEPGGLLSMGSHRVGHDWNDLAAAAACLKYCLIFRYTANWFSYTNIIFPIFVPLYITARCWLYYPVCVRVCAQLCPTLCRPMDCNLLGSSVHGMFQERILEWVAISSFRMSFQPRDWTSISWIGRQILYYWATWEAPYTCLLLLSSPSVISNSLQLHGL